MQLDDLESPGQRSRRTTYRSMKSLDSTRSPKSKKRVYDIKVGEWDPGELARVIHSKHDINQLIKDKIVESDPQYHFERIQLKGDDDYIN